MTKRFCDIEGCDDAAYITVQLPRRIKRVITDGHQHPLMTLPSDIVVRETDLCSFHATQLAALFNELKE